MRRRDIDDLLGAWALDALDPAAVARVENAIAADPALARTAAGLRRAATALGGTAAPPPSADVRDLVLAGVERHPAATVTPSDPATLFANQVTALSELLERLTPDEFTADLGPYDWTVHGLVAHLLVIERYTAGQLGLAEPLPDGSAGHLEIGADEIARELTRTGAATAADWRRTARSTGAAIERGDGPAHDAPVEFHRWPLTTASLLIARSFEVWTHADDIRRATGRPTVDPDPADLRTMSQFSVASLPLVLPLVAPDTEFGGARVVLTGAGGGTVDLGDPDRRDALIVTDVVDYCRVAARRIEIEDLDATIEGDATTAGDLLAAARVFAV